LNSIPGPGSYDPSSPKSGRNLGSTFRRNIKQKKEKTPGPGDYNTSYLKNLKKRSSHVIFSTARKPSSPFQIKNNPGPADYNTKFSSF
jgi:hypothetical protein